MVAWPNRMNVWWYTGTNQLLSIIIIIIIYLFINALNTFLSISSWALYTFVLACMLLLLKEWNVLFNDRLSTFHKGPSKRGKPLPPLHGLLFLFGSKTSFICTIPQTIKHIPQLLLWSTGWYENRSMAFMLFISSYYRGQSLDFALVPSIKKQTHKNKKTTTHTPPSKKPAKKI